MPTIPCSNCGQPTYRSPSTIPESGQVTCPNCSGYPHKEPNTACATCGKPIYKRLSQLDKKNYCSKDCMYNRNSKAPNTICEFCGIPFWRKEFDKSRAEHHFCGYTCAAKYRERAKTGVCGVCGQEVRRTAAQGRKSKSGEMFCSREHAKAWQLERRGANFLEKDFKEQFPQFEFVGDGKFWVHDGNGWMNPDFRIPHTKKLVELWGDYWHKDHIPQDRINRLAVKGFDTLIVWESDFRNHLDLVIQRVNNFLSDTSYIVSEPSS